MLTQNQFSLPKLIFHALTRTKKDTNEFKPFSIKVRNFYPSANMTHKFESMFGNINERPAFMFNATFPIVVQNLVQSPIASKLLGLIHLKSEYIVHDKHNWLLPSDIEVTIESADDTLKGIIYTVVTKTFQYNKHTMTNTNSMLAKSPYYKGKTNSNMQADTWTELSKYDVSINTARDYARASLDYNPIHLSSGLAKQFGLPNALIHGMFNVHQICQYILDNQQQEYLSNFSVEFNKPCYLPSTVSLRCNNKLDNLSKADKQQKQTLGLFSTDGSSRFVKFEAQKKEA